ncbi:MAG TPA: alpha-L-arabinofuranosidase C-terminal domain-containing protein [Verrucomicrobiota bacterium]|nr:alpha-L-arabinofuranosidase C-terminal domain-containing protein [Verrucomicrobiota bacterium]
MKTKFTATVSIPFLALVASVLAACSQTSTLTISTGQPGAKINPAMWGIFFEDINLGADGGLYAELVKNRSFEFPDPMMGWHKLSPSKARGTLAIRSDAPFNAVNPHYLRIESEGKDLFGVANEGFRGIGVKQGETYNFTAQIRSVSGNPKLRVELYSSNGLLLDSARLEGFSGDWNQFSAALRPSRTDAKAKLYLLVDGAGALDFDMVSLFPERTWKNRPGGLRADMVQKLADLKPGFFRFPGGCIVEGSELDKRYQWKKTIGPVEERELLVNRWNYEFLHRPAPDYYQTFGLGYFEYFQLAEDIGAEPMPILSCGLACQFNSGEACPLDQLEPFIQDAIDLIEFANGPTNSTWGAKRAAMGHPAPFNLKMIGIGNENWDQPYIDRYAAFHKVLKEKHPEIQLISSSGPSPDDKRFHFAWPKLRALNADIVDEHCYARPEWFFDNTRRYDNYDRKGPKVFFGEYAAQSDRIVSVNNRNTLECAIAEAAFMTGMERNAEVVVMASYAPLFAHVDGWQWTPNLIWVDNLRTYGTPNYYVQQLFAHHRGDVVLPVKLDGADGKRLYASATRDDNARELIVKLVNGDNAPAEVQLNLTGNARLIVLTGEGRAEENSLDNPLKISPKESSVTLAAGKPVALPANSLTVLRVTARQ